MVLALRIALNLKAMTANMHVKDFFQSRFKRQLIEKNTVEELHHQLDKRLRQARVAQRGK